MSYFIQPPRRPRPDWQRNGAIIACILLAIAAAWISDELWPIDDSVMPPIIKQR